MPEPIQVNDFFMQIQQSVPPPKRPARVRVRFAGRFLKGPICWQWLSRAARLEGKALHVAMVTLFLAGIRKSRTVALSSEELLGFGVKRTTGYRSLTILENAGLVTVDRKHGRSPRVTIRHLETLE